MATKPRQFRLTEDTLEELDMIADYLKRQTGSEQSRADAIRYATRQAILQMQEKEGREKAKSKSKKSGK